MVYLGNSMRAAAGDVEDNVMKNEDGGISMASTEDGGVAGSQTGLLTSSASAFLGVNEVGDADRVQMPLLKASPPLPVGTLVGRFRVRIWRATIRQPFGINFMVEGTTILIAEDLEHLGIRRFDRLVLVNGRRAANVDECRRILSESLSVDLVLQHSEMEEETSATTSSSCAWSFFSLFGRSTQPVQQASAPSSEDYMCFGSLASPRRTTQQLRVLLSTTRPAVVPASMAAGEQEDGVEFDITLQRVSQRQRFGLNFCLEPMLPSMEGRRPRRILVSEDAYQLGVNAGDVVLAVNGVAHERNVDCQKMLERSMTVSLRLRRPSASSTRQIFLPVEIELASEDVEEVLLEPFGRPCGETYCI
jgi:hypothetical protein